MPEKKFKPIFERSLSEQSALLRPQIEKIQQENLKNGFYNIFKDSNNPSAGALVLVYKDRKEFIEVDPITGHSKTSKTIR